MQANEPTRLARGKPAPDAGGSARRDDNPDGSAVEVIALPEVGDRLSDCVLVLELGRGAEGAVFLAVEEGLGRRIVVKVTPREGEEHLALAQLQHTHIAPLLFVTDIPGRGLRMVAMPFQGSATLGRLLAFVRGPLRDGRTVLTFIDRVRGGHKLPPAASSEVLRGVVRALDGPAACARMAACLADALQHAHERGLVHLDIKPGNVLLTDDALPVLLDFHLARPPLPAGALPGERFGGTPEYMAPEHKRAFDALCRHEPSPCDVDARADTYALGAMLHEMLCGLLPDGANTPEASARELRRLDPRVGFGLSLIVAKCLEPDPADRYPSAAALAADLRRHLADLPLKGVRERDWGERFAKWRRRNPQSVLHGVLLVLAVTTLGMILGLVFRRERLRVERVEELRRAAENLLADHEPDQARAILEQAPPQVADDLALLLDRARRQDEAARARRRLEVFRADLRRLAEAGRVSWDIDRIPPASSSRLDAACAAVLANRRVVAGESLTDADRADLLDVALFAIALAAKRSDTDALARLRFAEGEFGRLAVFAAERARLEHRPLPPIDARSPPRECYFRGVMLMRDGRMKEALSLLSSSCERVPDHFRAWFHLAVCATRLDQFAAAEAAFGVCLALRPHCAECRTDRAVVRMSAGKLAGARSDLDAAVALDASLSAARFHRGVLNAREDRIGDAVADFEDALRLGAEAGPTHYNLALVHRKAGRMAEMRRHAAEALRAGYAQAKGLE